MRAESRDSLRATVLAWNTPLVAARCISGCAAFSASCACDLSPPAIACSTLRMKPRTRDFRARLRRVRFSVWRMRLRAEAVFAMGEFDSKQSDGRAYRRHARRGFLQASRARRQGNGTPVRAIDPDGGPDGGPDAGLNMQEIQRFSNRAFRFSAKAAMPSF